MLTSKLMDQLLEGRSIRVLERIERKDLSSVVVKPPLRSDEPDSDDTFLIIIGRVHESREVLHATEDTPD